MINNFFSIITWFKDLTSSLLSWFFDLSNISKIMLFVVPLIVVAGIAVFFEFIIPLFFDLPIFNINRKLYNMSPKNTVALRPIGALIPRSTRDFKRLGVKDLKSVSSKDLKNPSPYKLSNTSTRELKKISPKDLSRLSSRDFKKMSTKELKSIRVSNIPSMRVNSDFITGELKNLKARDSRQNNSK